MDYCMYRDRTNLYLSYRRTIPREAPLDGRFENLEEEERLIESRRAKSTSNERYKDRGDGAIEMKPIIPSIFEIALDLDGHLVVIKREVNELNTMYKKLIIVSKLERKLLESRLEELNYRILKDFEKCYILVKKFEYLSKNWKRLLLEYTENDLEILSNFQKSYAAKIQDNSLIFRNLQNNYIKFLRDDEDEADNLLSGDLLLEEEAEKSSEIEDYSKNVLQQQKSTNSRYLEQRDKEISNLAMGILEILTIFKEMESMIIDQGTLLDRIDYNLQSTAQDLKLLDKELVKAQTYQKRTTKCKLIFLLTLVVFALFMLVIVKLHGTKTVVEKPADPQRPGKVPAEQPEKNPAEQTDNVPAIQPEKGVLDDGILRL